MNTELQLDVRVSAEMQGNKPDAVDQQGMAYRDSMYGVFKLSRLQNLLGQAGGSIGIVVLTWNIADQTLLLTYLAIHQLLVLVTGITYYSKFTNSRILDSGLPRFVGPVGIVARTFCGSIFWIDLTASQSFTFVVTVLLVLCSSVVGVFVTIGPLKQLARQTLICLLLPGALACLYLGHYAIGVAVLFFLVVVAFRGVSQLHIAYRELISLRVGSVQAAKTLEHNNRELTQANRDLEREVTRREQIQKERTELQEELVAASREAGKAEIATDVLHNVGNVMNSVNVSTGVMRDSFRDSFRKQFRMAIDLIESNGDDLPAFFALNPRAKHFVPFLNELDCQADEIYQEMLTLREHIDHVNAVVAAQQSFATTAGIVCKINPEMVVESAIQIASEFFNSNRVTLKREFDQVPDISVDNQKLVQIFVNLFRNATNAIVDANPDRREITVRLYAIEEEIVVDVTDTGIGIKPEDRERIFQHGFSTRKGRGGHGFGLHHSVCAVNEMNGSLTASSEGQNKGATFTVRFPAVAAAIAQSQRSPLERQ